MSKTKELILWAENHNRAICAFNFSTIDVARAILEKTKELGAPVILETSPRETVFLTPKEAHTLVGLFRPPVNFTLHLDHGNSESLIEDCVLAGYDSIHVDLKIEPFEEFVEKVRLITIYCHSRDVAVEAGIGEIAGSSTLIPEGNNIEVSTDPEKVFYFATKTGIDFLLVSIGETHGMSEGRSLDFDLLADIHRKVPLPLVLHGGSGIAPDDLKKAICLGVRKINFNTELRLAWANGLKEAFAKNPSEIIPYRILPVAYAAIQKVIEEKIKICTLASL